MFVWHLPITEATQFKEHFPSRDVVSFAESEEEVLQNIDQFNLRLLLYTEEGQDD